MKGLFTAAKPLAAFAVILIWTVAATYASAKDPLLSLSGDMFAFISRAKNLSLADLTGWVNGLYPLGYPLLLRITAGLFGDYGLASQFLSIFFGIVGLFTVFRLTEILFSTVMGILAVTLYGHYRLQNSEPISISFPSSAGLAVPMRTSFLRHRPEAQHTKIVPLCSSAPQPL